MSKEESLDKIFGQLDDWLLNRQFGECSAYLRRVIVENFSTAELVVMLTATVHARGKLRRRNDFFQRVHRVLESRGEDADVVLKGLGPTRLDDLNDWSKRVIYRIKRYNYNNVSKWADQINDFRPLMIVCLGLFIAFILFAWLLSAIFG